MKQDLPNEGCGVFIRNNNQSVYMHCRNVATNGKHQFLIDDRDWIVAQIMGKIVGIVHSHPTSSAQPSEFDKLQAKQFNLPFHIISMVDYKMETYIP
jgi:proteasome lid subunit RPN8/RPN11